MEPKWSSALWARWRQNRKNPGVFLLAGIPSSAADCLLQNKMDTPAESSVVIGRCPIIPSVLAFNSFYARQGLVLLLQTSVMRPPLLFHGNSFPVLSCQQSDYHCVSWLNFYPPLHPHPQGLPRFFHFQFPGQCLGLKMIRLTGRWSKIKRLDEAKMGNCPSAQMEGGSLCMDTVHGAAWHWWEVNRNITQMVKHADEILSSRDELELSVCLSPLLSFSSGQDESDLIIMTV